MYRLDTATDLVIFIAVSLALVALGALLLVFPRERLPEDPRAYRAVAGVLQALKDDSPRRSTWVVFALEGDETRYVATLPPMREESRAWVVGQTRLRFFVLAEPGDDAEPLPAYGITAGPREARPQRHDIDFHNAGVNPWGGLMALGIGAVGVLVAVVRWRQIRAA